MRTVKGKGGADKLVVATSRTELIFIFFNTLHSCRHGIAARSPGASGRYRRWSLFSSDGRQRRPGKIPLPFGGNWVDNAAQQLTKSKPIEK
jgi:hypothetical protein